MAKMDHFDIVANRIIAANEQDQAECQEWWDSATTDDKLRVWAVIQKSYGDPAMEIMSRFAQLTFALMLEKENAS